MKYGLLLIIGFLTACGSAPTENNSAPSIESVSPSVPNEVPATKSIETHADKPVETPKKETPSAAYAPLAEAYRLGNDDGIYRAAVQILSQNPTDVKALNAMGLYQYRKGRFLAARYFFSRALQQAPRSAEAHNNQGLVSLALDEPREAMRFFKKSFELNPNDGIAAANMGSIYVQERDYVKAQIALEIAIKKGMREPRTLNNYGVALAALGKFDQAKDMYDEVLKAASSNHEAMFNKAILLVDHLKQYSEGLDQLNRLKFLGPAQELRNRMNALENRAKAGIK